MPDSKGQVQCESILVNDIPDSKGQVQWESILVNDIPDSKGQGQWESILVNDIPDSKGQVQWESILVIYSTHLPNSLQKTGGRQPLKYCNVCYISIRNRSLYMVWMIYILVLNKSGFIISWWYWFFIFIVLFSNEFKGILCIILHRNQNTK